MNSLVQDTSLLLGDRESIQKLENQDSIRALCISDSHGAYSTVYSIIKKIGKDCDVLIFCGDGISDILSVISSDNCKELPSVIAFVRGNNDAGYYTLKNKSNIGPDFLEYEIPLIQNITLANHKITISHGHNFSLYSGNQMLVEFAQSENSELFLYGHTHVANESLEGNFVRLLNPGSCSLPRGGLPPSFATIDIKKTSKNFDICFYRIAGSDFIPFIPDNVYW